MINKPQLKIVQGVPPNYADICAAIPTARRSGVIFAYYPCIYVTGGNPKLPVSLLEHERVHIDRQRDMGVEAWWEQYINDKKFRYEEELLAHREEYRVLMADAPSRQVRRSALRMVAQRLASALYGGVVTTEQAMAAIQEEASLD